MRANPDCHRDRRTTGLPLLGAAALALCAVVLALGAGRAEAEVLPGATRLIQAPGKIVPIPASIPHEPGDMVDRRIIADLRWLASRFPIYITDAYSGPLPGGGHAGCRGCHVRNSDHHYGLAVDIVPLVPSSRCDARWRGITRLARFAEPRQNRPRAPFRWVGYDGDSGHGCGHHLHLSWNHGPGPQYRPAPWVEALPAALTRLMPAPAPAPAPAPSDPGAETPGAGTKAPSGRSGSKGRSGAKAPSGPSGGARSGKTGTATKAGPVGGISQSRTGGVAPRPARH